MTFLDEIASRIYDEVPVDKIPPGDSASLFRLYAVLVLAKREQVNACDVHNAWSAWMIETDPNHESIVPYGKLNASVAAEDLPFVAALRRVAQGMQK